MVLTPRFHRLTTRTVLWPWGRVLALLPLVIALGVGCALPVAYQPKNHVAQALGREAAQHQLRDVLLRATLPKVTTVSFAADAVKIKWQQSYLFFYQIVTDQMENDLYFAHVDRLEIYENNFVFVYYSRNRLQMKILFPTREDAQIFVDLLWSLRTAQQV